MQSIVSIIGRSGSGKTTLLERLIVELKQRGYKVGIVKHSHHDADPDIAHKDTWRYTQAGSEFSAINSLDYLAIYRRTASFDPRELSDFLLWDYDLILTEGFKRGPYPKIEVHDPKMGNDLLTPIDQLLAVVSDEPIETSVPQFTRNDIPAIAGLIEKTMKASDRRDDIDVIINGKSIDLTDEEQNHLEQAILTILPLKEKNEAIRNAHISLRRKS